MGCLLAAVAAVLALAIPASIAHTSLIGAYVVIAVFAALGAGLATGWARRHPRDPIAGTRPAARFGTVITLTAAYAVVVTLIHLA